MLTATLWVTHRKQQKSKKGDIIQQHIDIRRCGAGKYHLFYFCCFRCVTHYVDVNICINSSFWHLYLLFYYRFWIISCTKAHLESNSVFGYSLNNFRGSTMKIKGRLLMSVPIRLVKMETGKPVNRFKPVTGFQNIQPVIEVIPRRVVDTT